jgi:hypothetical protein
VNGRATCKERVAESSITSSRFWQISPDLLGVLKADGYFGGTPPATAGNGGSSLALLCLGGAKGVAIRAVEHGVGLRRPGAIGCRRGAAGVNPPPPPVALRSLLFLQERNARPLCHPRRRRSRRTSAPR